MENYKLTDFMISFIRLKTAIKNENLILIIGEEGTGRVDFVKDCISEFYTNTTIINLDKHSNENIIIKQLKMVDMFDNQKIFIYNDKTIKLNFVKKISDIFDKNYKLKKNNKFIIIVNEYSGFLPITTFSVHKIKLPLKNEVLRFLGAIKVSKKVKKDILSLDIYKPKRIQYIIEDGYYSGYDEVKEKYDITNNNYILSMTIAENLTNLRRLSKNEEIIEADKLKFINDHFYKDYLNVIYNDISKRKLRFPKELLKFKKGDKSNEKM